MYILKKMFDMEISLSPLDWSYAVIDTPANYNTLIHSSSVLNLHLLHSNTFTFVLAIWFNTGAK